VSHDEEVLAAFEERQDFATINRVLAETGK
jgi:hypothetical protein